MGFKEFIIAVTIMLLFLGFGVGIGALLGFGDLMWLSGLFTTIAGLVTLKLLHNRKRKRNK